MSSAQGAGLVLFVVNTPNFFLSHRLPIAIAARAEGFEVHVATASGSGVSTIKSYGFGHHVVPFTRSGQNPLKELNAFLCLVGVFKKVKPSIVHLITIKPVLYGGIAARLTGVQAVVGAVSGLGTVFVADSVFASVRRWVIKGLYRASFKQNRLAVIFQNPDDRDTLLKQGALSVEQTRMIRGSGVSLAEYPCVPEPVGPPVVVMAARLLRDKGVLEFVEAAKILQQRKIQVEMRLIGSPDPGNPTAVSEDQLADWAARGWITVLGFRSDIAAQYAAANIVCLPSYREGLPKSLVEAAACGRAVVTTDVPGCRDAISPGKTGLLVKVQDSMALANGIQALIESPGSRKEMGLAGRALAETEFAVEKIVGQHMDIYRELIKL